MNQEELKVTNAFAIEARGFKFRWECPYCFLDQYGETTMEFGDMVRRRCENPDCNAIAFVKIEEE